MGTTGLARGIVTVIVVVQVTGGSIVLKAAIVSQNGRTVDLGYVEFFPDARVLLLANTAEIDVTIFSSKQLRMVVPLHDPDVPVGMGFPWFVGHTV